jgi:hypothetical protein
MPLTNYIFVDYENVRGHDMDFALLEGKRVEVILLIGKRQNDLPVEFVQAMIRYAGQFRIEKVSHEGKNALDFVLAYHIGRVAALDPSGSIYVFSRDKDYDPLLTHLRAHHVEAHRCTVFADLPCFAGAEPKAVNRAPKPRPPAPAKLPPPSKVAPAANLAIPSPDDRLKTLRVHFAKNQPKRKKTLESSINGRFGKELSEKEIAGTIDAMIVAGMIAISEKGAVEWRF